MARDFSGIFRGRFRVEHERREKARGVGKANERRQVRKLG